MTTPLGGLGPWYVSLLFNTSEKCKKKTHLIAHTLPHLAVDFLNKPPATLAAAARKRERKQEDEEEDDGGGDENACWVMMLKVGPFDSWLNSVAFWHLWTCQTRGKTHRLERGIELYHAYGKQYGLRAWAQTNGKEHVLTEFFRPQPVSNHVPFLLPHQLDQEQEQLQTANDDDGGGGYSLEAMNRIFSDRTDDAPITVETLKEIHVQLEGAAKRINGNKKQKK